MKLPLIAAMLTSAIMSTNASAHCVQSKYYLGGGIGINSSDNYSETTGYQLLGGICSDFNFKSQKSKTSLEFGYMSSGEFSRTETVRPNPNRPPYTVTRTDSYEGLWISGLAEYKVKPNFHLLARIGYDIGDDDGGFLGAGIGINVTRRGQIRMEMVAKHEVDSVQFNWISEF